MQLEGRACIVTGAAGGIGAAIVKTFVARGASVLATDLDMAALEASLDGLSRDRVLACAHDVSDEGQWAEVTALAAERFGGLDVLVNNAGVFLFEAIESMTLSQWRRMSQVNLDGPFLGTKHAIGVMKDPQRRARGTASIVNMSSVAGMRGSANLSAYCMTKGGLRLFSKAAAAECGALGIRVNSIHPGVIDTEMGMSAARQRLESRGMDAARAC